MEDGRAEAEGNELASLYSVGREEVIICGELTRTFQLLSEEADRRRIGYDRVREREKKSWKVEEQVGGGGGIELRYLVLVKFFKGI